MWTLFKKDLLRLKKHPSGFLVLIVLPVAATALLGFVFGNNGNNGITPHFKLIIEDHDDSLVSRVIISGFSQKELAEHFDVELVEKDEGRAFIEDDKAAALVIIPEGFNEAFFSAKPAELQVVKNPSRVYGPKIIEEMFRIIAEGCDRIIRIAEAPIKTIKEEIGGDDFPLDNTVAKISVMINQIMKKAIPILEESPITIKTRTETDEKSGTDNNTLLIILLSGIGTMCLYFLMETLAIDYIRERENHTLKRILVSPASTTAYMLSKQLYLVIAGLMSLILVWAIAFIIWGIQVEASQVIPFFVMLLLTALSSAGIISCFYAVGSRTQATVILPAVILIFALIGGGVVPFQVLPDFLEQFSVVSPIYWSAHGFQTILMGSSINGIIKHIVILGIISVCLISAPVLIQRRRAIQ